MRLAELSGTAGLDLSDIDLVESTKRSQQW